MDEPTKRATNGKAKPAKGHSRAKPDHADSSRKWMTKDLENSLIQRIARLEAALSLTNGTVHDVNNVLTVLSGNLFLLTEAARDQPKLYEQARRARNAAERGSTLLRELLTFEREPDFETQAISPGNHVTALKPMLERAVGAEHKLEIYVDRNAGSVIASAAQFESALINLVVNARDAVKPQGEVRISVRGITIDDAGTARADLPPGSYVCVEVADDGCGIPTEYLERVTEPLFSTKPSDRGSGLGLSMVKRFAEQAGGVLCIDSIEGRGTRVAVWLPHSEAPAETTANMTLPLSTLPGGDELLLLVSRDHDVSLSIQQILETLGYTVLLAEHAEQADRILTQAPVPSLLIVERSNHPTRMEQRWLATLREANGDLRYIALLQTGADAAKTAPDADGFLFRPVIVSELARTVRHVLET